MLRQYQLHGGIRRLKTHFDQSKRFGTTTTMAASAAPTPWNRPPPQLAILDGGMNFFEAVPPSNERGSDHRSSNDVFGVSYPMVY